MKRTRRFAQVLLMLLGVALPALAEKVATMPAPTGYINDYAAVLSSPAKSDMEATARELHDKTRAQVFLVTINTLEGEPVETFANELFAKWKIGEKKTDRGVLMLFAIKDRKRWIEVGYGLEGILNDAKVGDIGREMVPALREKNYDEATKLGFDKICSIIAADSGVTLDTVASSNQPEDQRPPPAPETPPPSSGNSAGKWFLFLPFLIPVFIVLFMIWQITKAFRRRAAGGSAWSSGGSSGFNDGDSFSNNTSSSSDDSFSGGDGGSSGGGGAGGDW